MAVVNLNKVVQGAVRPGQTITWQRSDGAAVNLTGATLTGRIRNMETGIARNMEGVLIITNATGGIFTWDYHANDVATSGRHEVQFIATYSGEAEKSFTANWYVYPAI